MGDMPAVTDRSHRSPAGAGFTAVVGLIGCLVVLPTDIRAQSLGAGESTAYTAVINFDRADYYYASRHESRNFPASAVARLDTAIFFILAHDAAGSIDLEARQGQWNRMTGDAQAARRTVSLGSLSNLIGNHAAIDNLASQVVALQASHGVGGLDIDWEDMPGAVSTADYAATVSRLAAAVRPHGIVVSTSHAQGNQYLPYAAAVAGSIDLLNLQFYFASNNAMDLPTFQSRLAAYVNAGLAASQIRVGLPSYGMVSGSSTADKWRSWSQLVDRGANITSGTTFTDTNGETYYYSGTELITAKIAHAKANGFAGVFSWELTQDLDYYSPSSFNRLVDTLALDSPPVLELNDANAGSGRLGTGVVTLGDGAVLNNGVLRFARSGTQAVANRIEGTGSIVKRGSGTLHLQAANGFSGGTTIEQGALVAAVGGAVGTGPVTIQAGAALQVTAGMTLTNRLAGAGSLTKSGGGTLRLAATDSTFGGGFTTFGGSTEVFSFADSGSPSSLGSGGTIRFNGGSLRYVGAGDATNRLFAIGPATVSGGTGFVTAAIRADGSGPLVFSDTGAIDVGGFTTAGRRLTLGGLSTAANTFAPRLADPPGSTTSLLKQDAGSWRLTGDSSFSGGTTIEAGTLVAGLAGALGIGPITVRGGGTLEIADGVAFSRPLVIDAGGRVVTGDNSSVALPSAAALVAWESTSGKGAATRATALAASGSTAPVALTTGWSPRQPGLFSDILRLEGTGAGNSFVLSLAYDPAVSDPEMLRLAHRPDASSAFMVSGTSSQGTVAWNSSFVTVGQYGVDPTTGTVWAVMDHNSEFAVVPEPASLWVVPGITGAAVAFWRLRRGRTRESCEKTRVRERLRPPGRGCRL